MTRKRLMKLLMGLGADRNGAKSMIHRYRTEINPGTDNKTTLSYAAIGATDSVKDVFHAKYIAKGIYSKWLAGEISDGEMVRQIRQKLELTKYTAVVTINRKKEEK